MDFWHFIVILAPILIPYFINEFIFKIKQRKKAEKIQNKKIERLEKKQDKLSNCFLIYVKTNGAKKEIKDFVEKELGGE